MRKNKRERRKEEVKTVTEEICQIRKEFVNAKKDEE